ncbi:MAG: GWxTD domain-containing protein [Bacteroidales bacterium]|nr:GWxTD domain-containing protein [Bacteroidales bacterium]
MNKLNKNISLILINGSIVVSALIIWACSSPYTVSGTRWNLAAIYNPASSKIHPAFRVYHHNDNYSLLLVKLFPSELLFSQANEKGIYMSKVSVELQAFEIKDDETILVDSTTYKYEILQKNVGRRFISQIPFKAEMGKRYQLRIVTRDILRKDFNLRFIEVDKLTEFSPQNFLLSNHKGTPYFNNVVPPEVPYKLQHRNSGYDSLYIDYYRNQSPLPKPTFATGTEERFYSKSDSTYILEFSPDMFLSFSYEGMYRFRFDTNSEQGLVVTNFGKDFPKVKTPEELIEPLAYITTTANYQNIKAEENKKLAVDDFWLEIGGSTGRAREMIRIYYNRVYYANYYFTVNKPGWKTDRGMIYIVYGPPQNMKKSPNSETWIYYLGGASSAINFTFNYQPNIYGLENFVLQRSDSHDWHWREAVDSWRSGEIFLLD